MVYTRFSLAKNNSNVRKHHRDDASDGEDEDEDTAKFLCAPGPEGPALLQGVCEILHSITFKLDLHGNFNSFINVGPYLLLN